MKEFIFGFVVSTAVWLAILSYAKIPEYTVIHECAGLRT